MSSVRPSAALPVKAPEKTNMTSPNWLVTTSFLLIGVSAEGEKAR